MARTISSHSASDQDIVAVSFNLGTSLAQELPPSYSARNGVDGLSKKLPLHIRMEFERLSAASEEAALEQILGVSSRCAVVRLRIPHALYVGLVNRPAVFPILRRLLFLPIDSPSPEPLLNEGCTPWNCVPALEELVTFSGAWLHPFPSSLCLTHVQLLFSFDPSYHATNMLLDLLGNSKTLISVTSKMSYAERQLDRHISRLTVNTSGSAKTLCLRGNGFRLLDHICLPGLRSLLIDTLGNRGPVDNAIPIIFDFLNRNNPRLEVFSFTTHGEDTLSIMPLMLLAMPHLKSFTLKLDMDSEHDSEYLSEFFDKLARNDGGVFEVLPGLERLSISFSPLSRQIDTCAVLIEEVDSDHFVEMVRARTAFPNSRLRLVEVSVCGNGYCNLDEADLCVLQEYARRVDGLKITISDARF
ncbi:hypothetical protein BDZ89DRAFT_1066962 [Hymenopellis radicata]|nr:hypothetical protein BDZ89DRAFT_1066962 [Hymenopellis radicata]